MPRTLDSLTPAEILPVVSALMDDMGHGEWYDLTHKVAAKLDSSYENTGAKYRWDTQKVQVRFEGRVKRALAKLEADGKLVRSPHAGYRNAPVYWTPAAWKGQQEAANRRLAAERAAMVRWDRIEQRLAAQGYHMLDGHRLSAHDFEQILDRLDREAAAGHRKGDSTDE